MFRWSDWEVEAPTRKATMSGETLGVRLDNELKALGVEVRAAAVERARLRERSSHESDRLTRLVNRVGKLEGAREESWKDTTEPTRRRLLCIGGPHNGEYVELLVGRDSYYFPVYSVGTDEYRVRRLKLFGLLELVDALAYEGRS